MHLLDVGGLPTFILDAMPFWSVPLPLCREEFWYPLIKPLALRYSCTLILVYQKTFANRPIKVQVIGVFLYIVRQPVSFLSEILNCNWSLPDSGSGNLHYYLSDTVGIMCCYLHPSTVGRKCGSFFLPVTDEQPGISPISSWVSLHQPVLPICRWNNLNALQNN